MPIYKVKLKARGDRRNNGVPFRKTGGVCLQGGAIRRLHSDQSPETDAEGNTRGFSLASAPYEDDLMSATRMRDTAFKRVLKTMPLGTELTLDAPYGSFTLHNNAAIPAVFVTGGIGVTPVRSIVLQAIHDQVARRIIVIDSNKRPEDAAFLNDLNKPHEKNPHYTFVGTMTGIEKSNREWHEEIGHMTKAMLSKYIDDLAVPIFYVAGPQGMVASMRKVLTESGVNEDNIRTEEFTGY